MKSNIDVRRGAHMADVNTVSVYQITLILLFNQMTYKLWYLQKFLVTPYMVKYILLYTVTTLWETNMIFGALTLAKSWRRC